MFIYLAILTTPALKPNAMYVLPRWGDSKGVKMEIETAQKENIPITFLTMEDVNKL